MALEKPWLSTGSPRAVSGPGLAAAASWSPTRATHGDTAVAPGCPELPRAGGLGGSLMVSPSLGAAGEKRGAVGC